MSLAANKIIYVGGQILLSVFFKQHISNLVLKFNKLGDMSGTEKPGQNQCSRD